MCTVSRDRGRQGTKFPLRKRREEYEEPLEKI